MTLGWDIGPVILEHLGKLHPYEHALVLLLAVTIQIARRRAEHEDE